MKTVRQRRIFECIYDEDEITEQILKNISSFDKEGKLLEIQTLAPEGDVIHVEKHFYDNGKLVQTIQEDLIQEMTMKSEVDYDGERVLAQRDYFTDDDYVETRYEYDDQGRVVAMRKQDNDGDSQGYTTYERNGDRTIETEFDEDGNKVTIQEYITDEHGNRIETIFTRFVGRDEIVTVERVNYRDRDTIVDVQRLRNNALIFEAINAFDEEGRRIGTAVHDYHNNRHSQHAYEYDEKGRVIAEEHYDGEMLMQVREVIFNEEGEIIEETLRQRLYEDYFQPSTTRIEIEYY